MIDYAVRAFAGFQCVEKGSLIFNFIGTGKLLRAYCKPMKTLQCAVIKLLLVLTIPDMFQSGIRGSRCEVDPCKSFCLNGGRCVRATDTETEPQCKCQPGMGGQRCEIASQTTTSDPTTYLYLFVLSLTVLAVISCGATVLAAHNWKLR